MKHSRPADIERTSMAIIAEDCGEGDTGPAGSGGRGKAGDPHHGRF